MCRLRRRLKISGGRLPPPRCSRQCVPRMSSRRSAATVAIYWQLFRLPRRIFQILLAMTDIIGSAYHACHREGAQRLWRSIGSFFRLPRRIFQILLAMTDINRQCVFCLSLRSRPQAHASEQPRIARLLASRRLACKPWQSRAPSFRGLAARRADWGLER